ncbi:MAG: hypothetical protein FJZ58_07760, partial [Chlamydiae bacterium]|nr:hypothetical protein [Chlamydiota bacterium]
LLKLLEEPPSTVFFLLLSSREGDILPTILSRCFRIAVQEEEEKIDEQDPVMKAFLSMLELFFQEGFSFRVLESLSELDKLVEKKEEGIEPLFTALLHYVRNLHYQAVTEGVKFSRIPSLDKTLSLIEESRIAVQRSFKSKVILEHILWHLQQEY